MSYKLHTHKMEVHAVDIDTMRGMSAEDYREYLKHGLIHVDHHDILRSLPAGYPIAVTKEQFKALMAYLRGLESLVGGD